MDKETTRLLVKIFAGLMLFSGVLMVIATFTLFITGGAGTMMGYGMMNRFSPAYGAATTMMGAFTLFLALVYLFVGYNIWNFVPWARIAGLVMSIISLVGFPLGTIVGIFGIWLFGFNDDTKAMFSSPARARTSGAAGKKQ